MVRAKIPPSKKGRVSLGKKMKAMSQDESKKIVKHKKSAPGTKALKEIRFLQKSTHLLIAKAPFIRVIRELIESVTGQSDYRITEAAVEALREATETAMTSLFEDAYLLSLHSKRVTLFPQDIRLLLILRNDYSLISN